MLSIQWITDTDYLLDQSRPDYYFMGGEPPGLWWTRGGAPALGLDGIVRKWQLKNLFQGYAPKKPGRPPAGEASQDSHQFDGRALVQNAGSEKRQAGWDLTFSAPKSVSVLWSAGDRELRAVIQQIHAAAVDQALQYPDQFTVIRRMVANTLSIRRPYIRKEVRRR